MTTTRISSMISALCIASATTAAEYPELHKYSGDSSVWGKHIQRTMGLLAESRPDRHRPVKILFYGQSIVGGQWHIWVERELREKYPHADLTVENKALGGYSSTYLVKTVEHDIIISQPDLVVFHVYGDHIRYEQIIHSIRGRTAAELMIMTDHWHGNTQKSDGSFKFSEWSRFYDKFLPLVADKYKCELVDVRWPWKEYLEKNKLKTTELLKDNAHLNEHGSWLMAQLALRQMLYRPELMTDTSRALVKSFEVGKAGPAWNGNELEFEFDGARVDLLRSHAGGAACRVFIDGEKPSGIPELTRHTRTTSIAEPFEWPEIMRVGFEKIPDPQIWTLSLESIDIEKGEIGFSLAGSVTGPDGSGSSAEDFLSESGQVSINSEDWCTRRKKKAFESGIIKPGMKIRWKTVRIAEDLYFPHGLLEKDRLAVHSLARGLKPGKHTLKLVSDGIAPPITRLRVYRPMLSGVPFSDMKIKPGDARLDNSEYEEPTPLD